MTRTQGLVLVAACALLLALLTGNGRVAVPHAASAPGQLARVASDPAVEALAGQLALRDHRGTRRPLAPSLRNPFAFLERSPVPQATHPRGAQPHSDDGGAPAAAPRPEMRLQGIAEDTADGKTARRAVLSIEGELFIVAEGDRVLGRYEVVRVSADAVEMKDSGGNFTLALR